VKQSSSTENDAMGISSFIKAATKKKKNVHSACFIKKQKLLFAQAQPIFTYSTVGCTIE
jgi:hypothetical protein